MRLKRTAILLGALVFPLFVLVVFACADDPVSQVLLNYQEILKANPMPAGQTTQAIKVAGNDTATVSILRMAPGAEVKPHYHKTYSETVYVIEGNGEMTLEGKVSEIKPGSVHFNPIGKVHATKNTGSTDLVALQIFTPAWKEPDRVFAP